MHDNVHTHTARRTNEIWLSSNGTFLIMLHAARMWVLVTTTCSPYVKITKRENKIKIHSTTPSNISVHKTAINAAAFEALEKDKPNKKFTYNRYIYEKGKFMRKTIVEKKKRTGREKNN